MKKTILFAAVIVCAQITVSWGQAIRGIEPGAVQERAKETLEYYKLEKRLMEEKKPEPAKELIEDKTKEEVQPEPREEEKVILINKIIAGSSEILSEEEIEGIIRPYEGRPTSIKDLFEMIKEINELYRKKGYIAAQAVLPPQQVEGGVVKIRLIEGHVGKVLVEDNKSTRASFFTRRISLKSGFLVKLDDLEKDLSFLNNTNDVKTKAELKPGEAFGTTDLVVKVEEPKAYHASVFFDNAGRDAVGLYRVGLILGHKSLLGFRDPLTISGYWANHNGTIAGSGSYSFPITVLGTRLGVSYDYSQIKIISSPAKDLDITGHSSDLAFHLSQPVIAKASFNLNGFMGLHFKNSTTEFDDVPLFPTRVRSLTYGFDFQSFDRHGFWYSQQTFTHGYYKITRDSNFFKYNGLLTRQQMLGKDFVLVFRGSVQLSNHSLLPASEQFFIGGVATVRGYPEGMLGGDKGYVINGEFYFPVPFTKNEILGISLRDKLKGFVFVDHGGAFPYKGAGESINHNDYITSTGVGLVMNISKYLTGRLILGVPLANRGPATDSVRFLFYLQSNLL